MTWPTGDVPTTDLDAGSDTPPRATFLSWAQKFNQLINHVSVVMRGVLTAADEAAARAALGAGAVGAAVFVAASKAAAQAAIGVPRGWIDGLALSTAGGSTTMTLAAGQAADSTATLLMDVPASIAKNTSAWAVGSGNGGLDTGSPASNTWYHWHLIRRPDTGVVDVLFSLSPTAPTLPTNYTQFRRIGSRRTNGSAQWRQAFQDGDTVQWDTVDALDFSGGSSTTAANVTTMVPTGIKVRAMLNVQTTAGGAQNQVQVSDPDVANSAPSITVWPLGGSSADINGGIGSNQIFCRTNTSAQVRVRSTQTDGTVRIATMGWIDSRGKDA